MYSRGNEAVTGNLTSTLTIGEEIGAGHFGKVHIGSDGIRDRLAVKVLRQLDDESEECWQRRKDGLLKEGANLEKACHRHVVPVYYVCESQEADAVHLVMRFCEGGSLEQPYQQGPLSGSSVLEIARDVCRGLGALHARGMLHRDIKPGNILLDGHGRAMLGDFGFVTDEIVEGYAAGGGYRDHLAPEFYTDRVSSVRSDLWALGVTLYRLLHGETWYSGSPAPQLLVPDGGFADKLQWLPHIGKDWRRLIRSMLNDDPDRRPANTDAVLRSLASIARNDWIADVAFDRISWSRDDRRRRIEVTCWRSKGRRYSWQAMSHPLASGRIRTLSKNSDVSWRDVERELKSFFS